jgi:hypothetical protein
MDELGVEEALLSRFGLLGAQFKLGQQSRIRSREGLRRRWLPERCSEGDDP